ncbi:MAG: hypothetical protein VKK03_05135 [Synechococcus sp.]|nr:hypothetical protein [Synechococcus sp.]
MPRPHRWSVTLVASSGRHPRWLDENGHFSSDPARALRLSAPEVAVQRLQEFMELHGWQVDVLNRFRLVPSPPLRESRMARLQPLQACPWQGTSRRQAA